MPYRTGGGVLGSRCLLPVDQRESSLTSVAFSLDSGELVKLVNSTVVSNLLCSPLTVDHLPKPSGNVWQRFLQKVMWERKNDG